MVDGKGHTQESREAPDARWDGAKQRIYGAISLLVLGEVVGSLRFGTNVHLRVWTNSVVGLGGRK